jgi:hypothetical protein
MGEWSEEEEGEAEERRKINETLGKSEDDSGNFKHKLHVVLNLWRLVGISVISKSTKVFFHETS